MILCVDVGNTNIVCVLYNDKQESVWQCRLPTSDVVHSDILPSIFGEYDIEYCVFSSVVAHIHIVFAKWCKNKKIEFICIKSYLDIGFVMNVDNPETVGIDRLLNLRGAKEKYSQKHTGHILVVDGGTATTYNLLTAGNIFLGGAITTGLNMMRDGLHEYTDALPYVDIILNPHLTGTHTTGAMQSGLFWGYIAQTNGMIEMFKQKYHDITVIGTGGMMNFCKDYVKSLDYYDDNLIIEGLLSVSEKILAESRIIKNNSSK